MRPGCRLAGMLLLLTACQGADTGVHWQFERMLVQPRYDAYGSSRFFADGRAMQSPPQATVPRDEMLGPAVVVSGMTDAGPATEIPIAVTHELLARGRQRFNITCATCHGLVGDAQSAVADKMPLRRPPSLHTPRVRALPTGRVFQIVRHGYGLMPSYAPLLTVEESWAVVAYVRALQLSQHTRLDELPAAMQAQARKQGLGR